MTHNLESKMLMDHSNRMGEKNCFRAKANCQVSIEELINAINVDSTCPRVNHDL